MLRTTDWSETSRIATIWTCEFGKVRVLAKGGRRLKSPFESALDLLTLCDIVFLRKSSGSLDLLTECASRQRYPQLRSDLVALYAAYYVAELMSEWTEDYDPHPLLFGEMLAALSQFGSPQRENLPVGPRLVRFELVFLRELGYSPALDVCAACTKPLSEGRLAFSVESGGVLCVACQGQQRSCRPLSPAAWRALCEMSNDADAWRGWTDIGVRAEVRQVLGQYVTHRMGRRPRLLPYLGS